MKHRNVQWGSNRAKAQSVIERFTGLKESKRSLAVVAGSMILPRLAAWIHIICIEEALVEMWILVHVWENDT